jgi:SPP1 family predicted phage head-tail adaptor
MNASELRHKIKFQDYTTSSDGMGGRTASEIVTEKEVHAKIVSEGSDVSYEQGQSRAIKRFTILCRYQPDYEITKKTRILWGTRILTPSTPINIDNLKIWMTFEVTES